MLEVSVCYIVWLVGWYLDVKIELKIELCSKNNFAKHLKMKFK